MTLPFGTQLIAGDTWQWVFDDLPNQWDPNSYTITVYLRGPGKLDLSSIAGSSQFEIDATSTQSNLPPGVYGFQVVITSNTGVTPALRSELSRGTVEILPNFASVGDNYDARSFVKKTLDALEAALADMATHGMSEYQIPGSTGGRAIRYMSRQELLDLRDEFAYRYKKEQIAAGLLKPDNNQVQMGFGDPSNPVLVRLWKNFPGSSA